MRSARVRIPGLALVASALVVAACVLWRPALAVGDANSGVCTGFPATEASPGSRAYLPDCRAYELVTQFEQDGDDVGLNGIEPAWGVPSGEGDAVDWGGVGACCAAGSGAANLYESERRAGGWQTSSLTPNPGRPLNGLLEEQVPVFWTNDLAQQTIFSTPASFVSGDQRPAGSDAHDLYLRGPAGSMTWLSRGPAGSGAAPDTAEFDGATPDAGEVVFSSAEQLTSNAIGLAELGTPPQFLYARNVASETTTLVDVDESDALISPYGASLGNGGFLRGSLAPVNREGTTTNAISDDGSKIFFESPPGGAVDLPEGVLPHLYMRDLVNRTTTPLDDPSSNGWARYEGASADGALVFFTSDEGLAGASPDPELYEFNTTDERIGTAPPMSAIPVSGGNSGIQPTTTLAADASAGAHTIVVADTAGFLAGRPIAIEGDTAFIRAILSATELELEFEKAFASSHAAGALVRQQTDGVIGETAIANDGSHVYFVANSVLATNANFHGETATVNDPNLYVYDTMTGQTTFIATLAATDVDDCEPDCAKGHPGGLVAEPDVDRPAVPTADGSVLVFASSGDPTGEDSSPATTLTARAVAGERTITVASTAGFLPGHAVAIDAGGSEELGTIEAVDSATELTLTEYGPAGVYGLVGEHLEGAPVVQLLSEIYRYSTADDSLVCVSCTPAGIAPTGGATLGDAGGGSYAPPDEGVPMSEDGSRIFFDSPDPLVPEAAGSGEFPDGPFGSTIEPTNVYEWENGRVYLISDGSTAGSVLDGTTPSGDDVFFTTRAQLVPSATEGEEDIYDARVGGGFPASASPPAPCEGGDCRVQTGSSVFFSVPASASLTGSANLGPRAPGGPLFSIGTITAVQRAKFARTGRLILTVTATAAGRIDASATTKLRGRTQRVAHASATLANAGTATLTLQLSSAARIALAKAKVLPLRLEATDSASSMVKIAELRLHA